MEWQPVSSIIIYARFRTKIRNISIIQCYAPTEQAEPEIKDEFFNQLTETLLKIKKQDIVIIMGDLNAKVGNENVGTEKL
jgi:exonuclease III